MTAARFTADGQSCSDLDFYAIACDPARSVVVEACAGSGKTWLLVSRILRALLDGVQPQEILAITYTRKAAGEMRQRLHEWLSQYAASTPAERIEALLQRGLSPAQAAQREPQLADLNRQVLITGHPVDISTFHAWFFQLLRSSPRAMLDRLGLHPGMGLIEDTEEFHPELMRRFQTAVAADAARLADYTALVEEVGRSRLRDALLGALGKGMEIELAESASDLDQAVPPAAALWPDRPTWRHPTVVAALRSAAKALHAKAQKRTGKASQGLLDALDEADTEAGYQRAWNALFTQEKTPRQLGDMSEVRAAVTLMQDLAQQDAQQRAHVYHGRVLRLARVLLSCWGELKRSRSLADMPDLERCALTLMSDPELSGWVQQRLDLRVRQLLIDEFQDTSPLQWHALWSWLSSYAGAGGGASGQRPPAVFIVGDPKQSIYRFRRAEPRVFEAARDAVVNTFAGTVLSTDLTRRNAPGVVAGLNTVFERAAAEGLYPGYRAHDTLAEAQPGPAIRHLPRVMRDERGVRKLTDGWRDTLSTPRREAETVLRGLEAAHLARAVAELIDGQGLAPGKIMVLARKRSMLGHAARALRDSGLLHVAAEALKLADLPEARDVIALLDVMASPGHDLSLAQVLKSPYFEASDAQLLQLSQRARQAAQRWWPALMAWAEAPPEMARAQRLLRRWRQAAQALPPHDLLDRMIHEGDLSARALAAAPRARRSLVHLAFETVLNQALALDDGRYATPYNLVRALRNRPIKMTPNVASDAVQLLTVHGAKGLEADTVFLLDTDAHPKDRGRVAVWIDWPVDAAAPACVAFVANENQVPPSLVALHATEAAVLAREELNLLYVALTRAKRQFVVSATEPHQPGPSMTWWQRLGEAAVPWTPAPPLAAEAGEADSVQVPCWPEAPVSRAEASLHVATPAPPMVGRAAVADDPAAARLGQAVHRVLEWATHASTPGPARNAAQRARWAGAAALEFGLPGEAASQRVLQLASQVLDSPDCAEFFDASALSWAGNEVPVAVGGQVLRIDRLVQMASDGRWWVLDYKLQSQPHQLPSNREQLQRYRAAVQALQPGQAVQAAFITAQGRLVTLPEH